MEARAVVQVGGEDEGDGGGHAGSSLQLVAALQAAHLLHPVGGLKGLWGGVATAEDLVLLAQLRHEERGARAGEGEERVRRGLWRGMGDEAERAQRMQRVQRVQTSKRVQAERAESVLRACADLGRETAPKQPASETPKRYWKYDSCRNTGSWSVS